MVQKKKIADKPVIRSPDVLSRRNKDKALHVLHLRQYDVYYTIDGVALELWELIDGKKTDQKLVECLQKKHPAQSQQIPTKVKGWLKQFKKYELIS